jgi:hypothetical protein
MINQRQAEHDSSGREGAEQDLGSWFAELRTRGESLVRDFGRLLQVEGEGLRQRVLRLGLLFLSILAGLVGAMTAVVLAVVFLLRGLAGAVSAALGTGPWLGQLVSGASVLLLIAAALRGIEARERRRGIDRLSRSRGGLVPDTAARSEHP